MGTLGGRLTTAVLVVWLNGVAVAHLVVNKTYYVQKAGTFLGFIMGRLTG